MDDSTFRAFRRDPNFLKTILPISDKLNTILQRIFEIDPQKRITISQLFEIMCEYPQLTGPEIKTETGLLTPPASPSDQSVYQDSPTFAVVDDMDSPMSDNYDDKALDIPAFQLGSPQYSTVSYRAPQVVYPQAGYPTQSMLDYSHTTSVRTQNMYSSGVQAMPSFYNYCGGLPAQHYIYPQQYVPTWSSVY